MKKAEKKSNPLFQSRPRNFRVGNNIQPKRNLTRFVRWPKYITFQRQKRILLTRIKVPPLIAQFSRALDKNQTNVLFRLLKKYSPEDTKQKKARLVQEAKDKAESKNIFIQKKLFKNQDHIISNSVLTMLQNLLKKRRLSLLSLPATLIQLNLLFGSQLSVENLISHIVLLKEKQDWVNLFTKRMQQLLL